ncbi:hypothetical protein [Chromobacterium haemolyticum]|uniref:hypothetical protein n=1 Tax=Chromobacterium TaxID=535 RepID=UPI0040567F83
MSIDYRDLFLLADSMKGSGVEAELRNSVGRAYYCAYHHALFLAENKKLPVVNVMTGSHEQLSLRFERAGLKPEAIMLRFMHGLRCKADYKLNDTITENEAMVQCQSVKKFIEKK